MKFLIDGPGAIGMTLFVAFMLFAVISAGPAVMLIAFLIILGCNSR